MSYLGLDLGGTHATCSLVEGGKIALSERISIPDTRSFSVVAQAIGDSLRSIAGRSSSPVSGLGIGIAALVDGRSRRVVSTNGKYEDATTFDFAGWARQTCGVPVRLENDARLTLRGEMAAGVARGATDVVMFTLGTGIGGVVAMDGRPLVGKHGQAGVLAGHVPVRENGRPCTCGGRGCAEAEAGGWALPGIAYDWPGFGESALARRPVDFQALFECASQGDAVALGLRRHCLNVWSMMTVAAVHSFDPEMVVFGGGVMASGAEILPFVEGYVHANTWTPWGKPRIVAAELGDKAAALGVPSLFAEDAGHV
jgi:glucokinase